MNNYLEEKLEQRRKNNTIRSLRTYEGFADFFSNDYLSLADYITPENTAPSPGSSRLIAGTTPAHLHLEQLLADRFDEASALLFNSGYTANLGVLSCIPQRGDIILFDERSHASIKDGIRLSLAKGIKFKHNDAEDLEKKLEQHQHQRCFVVTEGLFSMDGTFGALSSIDHLCHSYEANLIVDEAHSGGITGENGAGYCQQLNIQPFLRIFTLGKAFGSHGAFVTGNQSTIDYLINFSRPFIYTTALPERIVSRTREIWKAIDFNERQKLLQKNVTYFNQKFKAFDISSEALSPIKMVRCSSIEKLKALEQRAHEHKIGLKIIYPPTVPDGESSIRITIHANQDQQSFDELYALMHQELW